jgi:hypothetical protein
MSAEFKPGNPGIGGSLQKDGRPPGGPTADRASSTSGAPILTPNPAKPSAGIAAKIPWPTMPAAEQPHAATYKCPKCGTDAKDIARFCPRCHTTLRFECPSCNNRQRVGGKCEKCGIDFIKYIGAVVAAKKAEADAVHERLESRSSFMKNLLLLPIDGGISLVRYFFLKRDRN